MNHQRKTILVALLPAVFLPGVAALFYFVWFQGSALAQVTYAGTKIFMLVWPVVVILFMSHSERSEESLFLKIKRSFTSFRMTWDLKGPVLFGTFIGLLIFLLMMGLTQTSVMEMVQSNSSMIHEKSVQLGFYQHFWIFALFVCLIHSLIEEYYWRWFVYGWARKIMKPWMAMVLASVAFGFHHFVVTIQYFSWGWGLFFGFAVVIGGMIWCYMYEKQKTILGAWICHIFADIGIMWVGYQILFQQGGLT
jgi:uncharacterized protein